MADERERAALVRRGIKRLVVEKAVQVVRVRGEGLE